SDDREVHVSAGPCDLINADPAQETQIEILVAAGHLDGALIDPGDGVPRQLGHSGDGMNCQARAQGGDPLEEPVCHAEAWHGERKLLGTSPTATRHAHRTDLKVSASVADRAIPEADPLVLVEETLTEGLATPRAYVAIGSTKQVHDLDQDAVFEKLLHRL